MVLQPNSMDKKLNNALLFSGAITGLNNHAVLAVTPETEEFFHISPALITSSATKRGGVNKYLNCESAGNCKIQTSDLQDEIQNVQTRKIVFGTSVTMKSGAK